MKAKLNFVMVFFKITEKICELKRLWYKIPQKKTYLADLLYKGFMK